MTKGLWRLRVVRPRQCVETFRREYECRVRSAFQPPRDVRHEFRKAGAVARREFRLALRWMRVKFNEGSAEVVCSLDYSGPRLIVQVEKPGRALLESFGSELDEPRPQLLGPRARDGDGGADQWNAFFSFSKKPAWC